MGRPGVGFFSVMGVIDPPENKRTLEIQEFGCHLLKMHIERLRYLIEAQYVANPTGCGNSFGEILCWEIHMNSMTFSRLAEKWGVSLSALGELIWDHCKRLEEDPRVNHDPLV